VADRWRIPAEIVEQLVQGPMSPSEAAGLGPQLAKRWIIMLFDKSVEQCRLGPVAGVAGRIEESRCAGRARMVGN
jgi:hypothetical protein